MAFLALSALLLASHALAQNNTSTIPSSTTAGGSQVANPSAFATSIDLTVDDLWDIFIGPVATAAINTTVAATPVPSSSLIPPPPLYYSPFPSGQQVPGFVKNESWSFPKDFWYGVAGAAYQIEGAVKAEGRGPSIWDRLTHSVTNEVVGNVTGDVADNNYYLYKQDIARVAAIGVPYYSFSISWSRIFPFGSGPVNEVAIAHYNDVINTCIQYNVTPMVTLYHWDLPLFLQNSYGGWLSENIVNDFVEYARVAFGRFGDRVQHWFTINEPIEFCGEYPLPAGYFKNVSGTIPDKQQPYFCGHHALLAHAEAYHLGKSMMPNSIISFKNNGGYKIPLTNSSADAEAVQRSWDFNEGWFADPVFLTGDYPASLKAYLSTFLPNFTAAQSALINGTGDVFAHDAYTSQFYFAPDAGVAACVANASNPLYPACYNTSFTYPAADGGWNIGPTADPGASWLHKATDWVPIFLHYIQDTWRPAGGIAISEFGFAEPFEAYKTLLPDILFDPIRSAYYRDYLQGILIAISEDVKVVGCLAWAIYDNLEWTSGYSTKFGMQYVNLTTQERYYKASFFEYVNVFNTYLEQ